MDNDTPFQCNDCDRRFGVIWCSDYMGALLKVEWCPFCGSKSLTVDSIDLSDEEDPEP